MRKPISILLWVVLAVALVMLPAPARAAYYYSTVDVFSPSAVGTSITDLDSWEYYDGYRPYAAGTLRREWQTLGSNSQFNPYDSYVSVQVYAALEPGNALYSMDGGHFAGLDQWNLNYLGYSEGWYYYFDPAAWPPYIYGISPNVGVSGSSGYIPIYGAYLAPQGTTPVVSMDGATLWIVYQSDNQINVYYSNVSLGTHWLSVTTIYGTSNYVQFTALAGDATPFITSISPEEWDAGATTDFSIAGTGFGTNPGLTIDGGWIEAYGVYSAWDTGMNAWVRVSSGSPDQTVTVSVTSNGSWGNSFMEQYPNQPRSGSKNAQVRAVPPSCGDQLLDNLVMEYVLPLYQQTWIPSCSDFITPVGSTHFSVQEINQDNDYRGYWTITRQSLLTGLENIRAAAGGQAMSLNSGYRNPVSQYRMNPSAPNSRHTRGDAADVHETNPQRRQDMKSTYGPQNGACVEDLNKTSPTNYVHFDWRGLSLCPPDGGW